MTGGIPKRPGGSSARARFYQWVWDSIVQHRRPGSVRGAKVSSTTGGVFVEPLATIGESGSRVKQYILIDASKSDYFICRTLGQRTEGSKTLPAIGATDIFIAKPFHLRQSPFDRTILNAANPSLIGKLGEITYDIEVETWDDPDLLTETRKLSHDYKSATYRIVTDHTDQTDANLDEIGDNWTSQNQTIIPRFIPAQLIETLVDNETVITTKTQTPTIIYAIRCSGLESIQTDPDSAADPPTLIASPLQTDPEDGEELITLLALNDGWAWAKTS